MTTVRTPIRRREVLPLTARAGETYRQMGKLRCTCPNPKSPTQDVCPGCKTWYDLHEILSAELRCLPWQFPCVTRQSPKAAGSTGTRDENAAERMKMLDEAVRQAAL